MVKDFLPISREDMKKRGWQQCDFVYICGDAYVDHSSFGMAIITRLLESRGYKVGIIAQPDWKKKESITILGEPRLGFLVSAGNMDSMVNHYTVNKKHRKNDAYSPGGKMGMRPDYATIVYCNLIRQTYKKTPIIIGGIEASLRRMSHYDYWSDKMKHSILIDSGADIISYGMGEHSIVEIAEALEAGIDVKDITYIRGTVYKAKSLDHIYDDYIELPSYDEIAADKKKYAESFYTQYINTDAFSAKILVEKVKEKMYVVQNPPAMPLTQMEMDDVYSLPYMRDYHPVYKKMGGIPALSEIKFSLTSNRGCFGGCSFCALTFHQGRIIQTRSHENIIEEAELMTHDPDFKGYIHDVGGPTANFRRTACDKQLSKGVFKAYYPELLQTVIVYLFFTIWGLYYKKKLGWQIVVCVIAAVGYLIYAFGVERVPFDLQANKFPPNLLFASYGMAVLGIGGIYMKKGLVFLYDRSAMVRRYINIYSNEGYEIYLVHPFTIILLGGIKRLLGLDPIIADHLYLQMVYIVSGFLFILCVNVYVLKTYNYIWSLVNRVF